MRSVAYLTGGWGFHERFKYNAELPEPLTLKILSTAFWHVSLNLPRVFILIPCVLLFVFFQYFLGSLVTQKTSRWWRCEREWWFWLSQLRYNSRYLICAGFQLRRHPSRDFSSALHFVLTSIYSERSAYIWGAWKLQWQKTRKMLSLGLKGDLSAKFVD